MIFMLSFIVWMGVSSAEEACHIVAAGQCQKNVSPGRCGECHENSLCCCESPLKSKTQNDASVFLKNQWTPQDHLFLSGPIAEILWNNIPGEASVDDDGLARGPQVSNKEIKDELVCTNIQFKTEFKCDVKKISPSTSKILYAAMEPNQCGQSQQKELGKLKCSSDRCTFVDPTTSPKRSTSEAPVEISK
jgi:hypothetical protein